MPFFFFLVFPIASRYPIRTLTTGKYIQKRPVKNLYKMSCNFKDIRSINFEVKDCCYPHPKGTFWEWKLSFSNVSFLWLWEDYKVWHAVTVTKYCAAAAVLKWKTFLISWKKPVPSWARSQRVSLLELRGLVLAWDFAANAIATCATKEGGKSFPSRQEAPNAGAFGGIEGKNLRELFGGGNRPVEPWRLSQVHRDLALFPVGRLSCILIAGHHIKIKK